VQKSVFVFWRNIFLFETFTTILYSNEKVNFVDYLLLKISFTEIIIVYETKMINTSFKIALRAGFATRLVKHCKIG
jgi:hypothetical protein